MANTPKRALQIREVSLSVLEVRFKRAIRPKVRLWAMIRLAEELIRKDTTQIKRGLHLFTEAKRLAESISDRRGIASALRGAASCQHYLSNFAVSLEMFERALLIAEQTSDVECEILILREMGFIYMTQNRYDFALNTLTKCVELSELIGNTQLQASALNRLGLVLTDLGWYHEALEYHTKSLALLRGAGAIQKAPGRTRDEAIALQNMSLALQFLGKYAEGYSAVEQARQLFHSIEDHRNEGLCQASIAHIYFDIGDYPSALSSYLASVTILESIGDKLNLAIVHENLMEFYLKLGNSNQARDSGEEALAIFEEIDYKVGQADIFMHLGEYYFNRGEWLHAKQFLKQCIALLRKIGSKEREAKATTMLANLEIGRGKFADAEKLLRNALAITTESGEQNSMVTVLLGLGALFNKQSDPDRALPFLERAIIVAEEIHLLPPKQKVHQMLAETLEVKGDFKRALTHWKLASNIKEEILGAEKQKAIAAIQIQSAAEKAEKEKILLRKETKSKSQEIERMAMEFAEKTELIRTTSRQMREIIKPLSVKDPVMRSRLDTLLSNLDRSIGGKRAIPNEFQLVHRDLLKKLSKKYPVLTSAERKICVLVREGLSTKQIADMMKVSTRSIDSHRYHLRRKMKLERKTNLTSLLVGL